MSTTHLKRGGPAAWLAARSKRFWIVAALAIATAYPLSLGPFMWSVRRGLIDQPATALLAPVYAPLGIFQLLSPVERTMNWYLGLWRGAASEDISDGEVASDGVPDGTVFQVDIMPDGRRGLSFVEP